MKHGKGASTDHICHIIYCEMLWRAFKKRGDVSTVTHYLEIRELKPALTVGGLKENTRGRKRRTEKDCWLWSWDNILKKKKKQYWVAESVPDASLIPSTQV